MDNAGRRERNGVKRKGGVMETDRSRGQRRSGDTEGE